jgi:transcription antitermination factor NusG
LSCEFARVRLENVGESPPKRGLQKAVPELAQEETVQAISHPLELPPDAQPAPKWFAVYTNSRHEKRVAQHLSMRQIEHYLPLYRVQRKWSNGLRVTLDLPLFPGYIFVRIQRMQRVRVLEVPGVLALVGGTGGEPASLPETDIEALRSGLPLRRVEPHPLLKVGQRARIRSGAFEGMEGVVVRKKNSFRVVLTLDTIMQSFAVEVDGKELEPLDSGGLACAS